MTHSFVQQDTRPAATQYDGHCAGGRRLCFELHGCLANGFSGEFKWSVTVSEVLQIGTCTTTGVPLLPDTVLFHDHADIQTD